MDTYQSEKNQQFTESKEADLMKLNLQEAIFLKVQEREPLNQLVIDKPFNLPSIVNIDGQSSYRLTSINKDQTLEFANEQSPVTMNKPLIQYTQKTVNEMQDIIQAICKNNPKQQLVINISWEKIQEDKYQSQTTETFDEEQSDRELILDHTLIKKSAESIKNKKESKVKSERQFCIDSMEKIRKDYLEIHQKTFDEERTMDDVLFKQAIHQIRNRITAQEKRVKDKLYTNDLTRKLFQVALEQMEKLQLKGEKNQLEDAIRQMRIQSPPFDKVMLLQEFSDYMERMRYYDKQTKERFKENQGYINPENWQNLNQHQKELIRKELPDDIIFEMKKNTDIERLKK